MSDPSSGVEKWEFLELITALMRYRHDVMANLPEDITRLKQSWEKVPISDEPKQVGKDIFYRIGVAILSRYKEPMPMGELSKELDVPLSTATRIVDGLVASGVAQRVADPQDRRVVRVTLTEGGRELHQILNRHMQKYVDQVLSGLTSDERDQLTHLLRKIVMTLNNSSN